MVKVKICGITNLEDASDAVGAGCDALGFLFYKKSPRYISPQKARGIIKDMPKGIIKIGVFVNAKEKTIRRTANLCGLDMLQFHGDESAAFCKRFSDFKVIKAFRVKDKIDLSAILRYNTFAYLFDTYARSLPGGTGRGFNWQLLRYLEDIRRPIFLSGGLNENNILKAIKTTHPDWVDVSSALEIKPGKKDRLKMKRFLRRTKDASSASLGVSKRGRI